MSSGETTKITYSRRFNLGDYQHEEISIELSFTPELPCKSPREAIAYAAKELREGSIWYANQMRLKKEAAEAALKATAKNDI